MSKLKANTVTISLLNNKRFQNYLWNILGVLILVLLCWYLYQSQGILKYLQNIRFKHVLWIALLEMMSLFINSLLDWSIINRFNSKVSFFDCYRLAYANNFLNKILPTIGGGAAFRAAFMKKKYDFSYTQFISTVGGLYVISFLSTALIGLLCLGWIYQRFHVCSGLITFIFLGIFSFCFFVILFSPYIRDSESRVACLMNSIFNGWRVIKIQPKYIFIYIFLTTTLLLLSSLQILVSYQALNIETSFIPMLFLSTLGIIQAFLNFTPDGIGVREGIFVFTADLVQIPEDTLVLGSLVLRGISLFTTFVFGGISYFQLNYKLRKMHVVRTG